MVKRCGVCQKHTPHAEIRLCNVFRMPPGSGHKPTRGPHAGLRTVGYPQPTNPWVAHHQPPIWQVPTRRLRRGRLGGAQVTGKGGGGAGAEAGNADTETKQILCDHGKCWEEVADLEIYELTLCQVPMNQESYITEILQYPDESICPECYIKPGYDSSLSTR